MKQLFKSILPSLAAALTLGACSSTNSTPDVVPSEPVKVTTPSASTASPSPRTSSTALPTLGDDARIIRETASEAIANKDTAGARASVEEAIDKNIPDGSDGGPDKRTELIDKATDAARKKAKEMGKEEDLDKVRSALDNYLKKES